ncbi:MAG: FG-GAP repeat protein [bacterium]
MEFKKPSKKNILLFIVISWFCEGCAGIPIEPIEIQEQAKYERFGEYIIKAHIDGYAKDDLIICVPSYNSNRGKIYIFYGRGLDSSGRITSPTWANATIEGENEQDRVGEFVFTGDLNGDKRDDVIIGVPSANSNKGKIYIFYGGNISGNYHLHRADAIIEGEKEGDRIGENITIANLNKEDNDNKDDLIISVPTADANKGKVYIFYGGNIPRFTSSVSSANLTIQ